MAAIVGHILILVMAITLSTPSCFAGSPVVNFMDEMDGGVPPPTMNFNCKQGGIPRAQFDLVAGQKHSFEATRNDDDELGFDAITRGGNQAEKCHSRAKKKNVNVFNPFFMRNIDESNWKSLSGIRANRSMDAFTWKLKWMLSDTSSAKHKWMLFDTSSVW
nr:nuclear poly(A) polymerase 3 [Ipomoea batatas]